ncbi:SDR family NAD(P)-dependent oxidoreductase [Litorimonas haliclonae]|uniref:SDR family NAD(P)-dependent oxidoreductase n=1 Tax=Litorimonas haliclonae TaxID=2081977 RepID=UPI0039F02E56
MTISLDNKIILVTGADGGIGGEVCKALKHANATVIATDLIEPAEAMSDLSLAHDVTSKGDWAKVVSEIESRYGRLDGLVNNAGFSFVDSIENTDVERWRSIMSVNVESILHSYHSCLKLLKIGGKKSPSGASVVNISSVGGQRGAAFNAAYCATKAAVLNFSKSAAVEFGMLGYNIRVNSVHPGGVDTPMLQSIIQSYVDLGAAPSYDEAQAAVVSNHPIGRIASPSEMAGGVVYLCSDAASFMTGSELVIDGGFTAK